jgi:hypothetical protein
MDCPNCGHAMWHLERFDEEYQDNTITVHWRLICPYCNHYSIAKFTYEVTKKEMEWE